MHRTTKQMRNYYTLKLERMIGFRTGLPISGFASHLALRHEISLTKCEAID